MLYYSMSFPLRLNADFGEPTSLKEEVRYIVYSVTQHHLQKTLQRKKNEKAYFNSINWLIYFN